MQSMDDNVLRLSRRGHTREDTLRAAQCLKNAGMGVGVQLMTGLPGDTPDLCEQTARQCADIAPDLARIYPVLVLAGSPLARLYRRGGYVPQTLDEAVAQVAVMAGMLEGRGIPVVRMGLQAGEGLEDEGAVLAGPWHPAFGHLVRSALMLDQVLDQVMDQVPARVRETLSCDPAKMPEALPGRVVLSVHPRWESRLRGDKNGNLKILSRKFPRFEFQILTDAARISDGVKVTYLP